MKTSGAIAQDHLRLHARPVELVCRSRSRRRAIRDPEMNFYGVAPSSGDKNTDRGA